MAFTTQRPRVTFSQCGSIKIPVSCRQVVCKAQEKQDSAPIVNEDVLARLKAAEEEAAKLRKQLEVAQAAKGAPVADEIPATKAKRIDSTDSRETLFSGKASRSSWLSEADVEFFVGNGVGETSADVPKDPEAEAAIQRRLLIGGLISAGALAFALVPTEALRPKPPKPMYFYVVPLLRIQDLLEESKSIIEGAEWNQLRLVLSRIMGVPNNARENLDNIIALLDDNKDKEKAVKLAAELIEYLDAMDYNRYFDAIPTRTITGAQNAEFVKFSSSALKAAQEKLGKFLQLVPSDVLQTAFEQTRI